MITGWLVALPVPVLIALAPSWGWIVAANVFLGVNQGLAWSMTVVMKIDLVGPRRRGLALGLNESAGYVGVAVTARSAGALAASFAPARHRLGRRGGHRRGRPRDLGALRARHGRARRPGAARPRPTDPPALAPRLRGGHRALPVLRACSQAGLVNNLNDALAWGLVPLYLAANGASAGEIGVVAALYPAVWGVGQIATGWLSDHVGRKPLIVAGMLVQAAALGLLAAGGGAFAPAVVAAILLGAGTALVYPTLIAAVSDAVRPSERAPVVGVYRFWRDSGFVIGALLAGLVADALGSAPAIALVAVLTAASGIWVTATGWSRQPPPSLIAGHEAEAPATEPISQHMAPRRAAP